MSEDDASVHISLGYFLNVISVDLIEFIKQFQDYLAPMLSTYEQAVYLYVFRHSRLIDEHEVVIGFKSARRRLALGIGKAGTPMSEDKCYKSLRSLEEKGCLVLKGSERAGQRILLKLPCEIPGLIPTEPVIEEFDLESIDFFDGEDNRRLILEREAHKCFYCLCALNGENYVIEHVVSRPSGNSSYRNVVAGCRACNNRKGSNSAEDFMRLLYRDGFLNSDDLQAGILRLQQLRDGLLVPTVNIGPISR